MDTTSYILFGLLVLTIFMLAYDEYHRSKLVSNDSESKEGFYGYYYPYRYSGWYPSYYYPTYSYYTPWYYNFWPSYWW